MLPGDRRRDHRPEAGAVVELRRFGARRELRHQVVARDDDPVLGDGHPGGALPDRDPQLRALLVAEEPPQAVVERPAQLVGAGLQDVEDGPLPADQAARELDDLLEDLGRIAQRGDACGDLAQGLFRPGPAGERAAGPVELLEELGPGDGDGGLRGDRLEQAGIGVPPTRRCAWRRSYRAPKGPASPTSGAAITEWMPIPPRTHRRRSRAGTRRQRRSRPSRWAAPGPMPGRRCPARASRRDRWTWPRRPA